MLTNVQEIYASTVRRLPARARLQLAALILEDLARPTDTPDVSDFWDKQDCRDLLAFAHGNVESLYPDQNDDLV